MLALRGGAELVAVWAQLLSVVELVTGVALAGIGTGLVVYVARRASPDRRRAHLAEALALALKVTAPIAVVTGSCGYVLNDTLTGSRIAPRLFALAAAAGWFAIVPLMINNYWQGAQRYGAMLALAATSAAASIAALVLAPSGLELESLLLAQAAPAAILPFVLGSGRAARRPHPLRRYVLPGLAIGILGPLSLMAARGAIGEALSWHDAGVVQALFRVNDWICLIAGGFLSLVHLPRFATAKTPAALNARMRAAAGALLVPAALALAMLWTLHVPLLALLYDDSFRPSATTVALICLGSLVRIASWIPLCALYATRRTREIAAGELLSLPLFAFLTLLAGRSISLELLGMFWLVSYAAYGAFNLYAARKGR